MGNGRVYSLQLNPHTHQVDSYPLQFQWPPTGLTPVPPPVRFTPTPSFEHGLPTPAGPGAEPWSESIRGSCFIDHDLLQPVRWYRGAIAGSTCRTTVLDVNTNVSLLHEVYRCADGLLDG